MHIRIQQRNGKKSLTTVQVIFVPYLIPFSQLLAGALSIQLGTHQSLPVMQGLEKGIDYKKVLKAFKKDFCCNGTVVEDTELGQARCYPVMTTC